LDYDGCDRDLIEITSFEIRIFPRGDYRWVIRGVISCARPAAAACALVISITVAPTWMISDTHAMTPIEPPPHLFEAPTNQAELEIAPTPELTRVAKLTPAVAPGSPASGILLLANPVPLPRAHSAKPAIARSPIGQTAPRIAADTSPAAPFFEKSVTLQEAHNKSLSLPGPHSRTAVYDIAAHTVYLPNGERLEAHSGLGNKMDDPRYVNVKNRGPTPPNVYDLTLRELLFHGVRAIRLNPVDDDNMFGRDGMLAHSYMHGPNGQSSGCVSFKDYPRFLRAVLGGEVDRLVVVSNLGTSPLLSLAPAAYM
jgi:hypothetical protein